MPGRPEGAYEQGASEGVDGLVTSVLEHDLGRDSNVFAELGSTKLYDIAKEIDTPSSVTVYFLFRGDEPLDLQAYVPTIQTVRIVPRTCRAFWGAVSMLTPKDPPWVIVMRVVPSRRKYKFPPPE